MQVKARFSDEKGSAQLRQGRFTANVREANVREETFRPREDLYVLYVAPSGCTPTGYDHDKYRRALWART